jgi:hypothetical protein
MNLLRTIQKDEKQWWVDLFFQKGPHEGDWVPIYPMEIPFPFKLKKDVKGGFQYIVYKSQVIGYGRISKVTTHDGSSVGTHGGLVHSGDEVILAEPLKRMPFPLGCRGFTGVRYTPQNLHELDRPSAEREIRRLKLS